ncbi:MAG: acetylglutamate kinase [Betaproteobacteria bacterium AqS2]|uniref:Acetylglutamate kinase n=1 Tax=Candidatus Amphirhobacter heronislandensis TaxID=1732024 RepID=A0A930UEY8_9GAMM|nr:acetylglutamate kinase [Betaproteobacteria bacterium AqS2]
MTGEDSQAKDPDGFAGRTVVVKAGGELIDDDALLDGLAADVAAVLAKRVRVVVVHGGKPQIDRRLAATGAEPERIDGLRVTDEATVAAMREVYQEVAERLAGALDRHGAAGAVLPGQDGLLRARPIDASQPALRLVGAVEDVDAARLAEVIERGEAAIVSPLGRAAGEEGQALNVNADHAAAAVAGAVKAAALLLLTNVDGVRDGAGELLAELGQERYQELKKAGVVSDGMIPKVESGLRALADGVESCRIASGVAAAPVSAALAPDAAGTGIVA